MSNVHPLLAMVMQQREEAGLKIVAHLPEGYEHEGSTARDFTAYAKDAAQLERWKQSYDRDGVAYTVVPSLYETWGDDPMGAWHGSND